MRYWFKDVTVVTMDEHMRVLEHAHVLVDGSRISYVGVTPPDAAKAAGYEQVDCRGKVLCPGLYNTHLHIAMTAFRGYADEYTLKVWLEEHIWPAEHRLTAKATAPACTIGLAECISTGTVGFTDMYFFEPQLASMCLEAGIMANLSNSVVTFDPDYDPTKDRAYLETMELIKSYHGAGDGRIKADVSIHGEYTSPPRVHRMFADIAKSHNLNMHVHLSETKLEQDECIARHGKTPAAVLNDSGVFDTRTTAAHCVWVTEDDMDLLAAKDVTAVHDPGGNLKLASGIQNYVAMKRHGVRLSLATDSACAINTNDLFFDMKLAAILHKGIHYDPTLLPAQEALYMATVAGAYAQGREHESGRIMEGFDADLMLLDFHKPHLHPCHNVISNIVYAAKGSDVCLTMCKGKVLYKDGVFTTLDIERAYYDMEHTTLPCILGK